MKVYDATLFNNKPDATGMSAIDLWYSNNPMPTNKTGRVVLDKEDLLLNSPETIRANSFEMMDTLRVFKEQNPEAKLGWYGALPERRYWRRDEDWVLNNRMLKPLAAQVDFIYPSIYTFYDSVSGWVKYAKEHIQQARQYGKPVIPFLWMQYHNSNSELKGQFIDKEFWRIQMELVQEYADGCVIWGGYKQEWDDNHDWWKVTQQFID